MNFSQNECEFISLSHSRVSFPLSACLRSNSGLEGVSVTRTEPLLKKWDISPELETELKELDSTREWTRNPGPDALEPFRDMFIAARDCQVIAASKSDRDSKEQSEGEDCEPYLIMCPKPRNRFESFES